MCVMAPFTVQASSTDDFFVTEISLVGEDVKERRSGNIETWSRTWWHLSTINVRRKGSQFCAYEGWRQTQLLLYDRGPAGG